MRSTSGKCPPLHVFVTAALTYNRTRVISLGSAIFLRSDEADNNFKHTWEKLVAGEPATCFKTGKVYDALPKPSAVLTDVRAFCFL